MTWIHPWLIVRPTKLITRGLPYAIDCEMQVLVKVMLRALEVSNGSGQSKHGTNPAHLSLAQQPTCMSQKMDFTVVIC